MNWTTEPGGAPAASRMPPRSRATPRLWLLAGILAVSLWTPPEIHPLARLLVAAALAGLAVDLAWTAGGSADRGLLAGALATGCGLVASASLSLHPYRSLHFLITLAGACAFYLACRRWAAPARATWLAAFVVASGGVAAWACWQAGGGLEATLQSALAAGMDLPGDWRSRLTSGRPFGTLLLPAALGGLMAMAAGAAAGLAAGARGLRRAAASAACLLFLAVLALSRSFGALAAAALAALWAAGRLGRSRRAHALRLGALALAAAGALLFARARLESAGQDVWGSQGPIEQRRLNWATALDVVARYPALGCGPGAYASAFVGSRREGENDARFAHSTPLQAAAEGGIWMLLPMAWGVARIWPRLRRARAGSPEQAGAAAGFLSFAVHNLADFTAYLPSTLFAALALAAVLPEDAPARAGDGDGSAGAAGGEREAGGAGGAAPRSPALRGARAALAAALALACVAGLGPLLRQWRGETLREMASRAERAGLDPARVSGMYERAVAADPGRADLRLERAAFLLERGGRPQEAIEEARAAARADRGSAAAHLLQSVAWSRLQEWAEAFLEAEKAIAIHPSEGRARAWLERLRDALGRQRAAPSPGATAGGAA